MNIFLNVKNKRVIEKVCEMLADLHLKINTDNVNFKK